MNDFFGGLMNVTDWIETYVINGFLGNGFNAIMKAVQSYMTFKPIIDFFTMLFGLFTGAGA